MKIADRVHIVASGRSGVGLTDDYDCHVYLLDGGDEYALIDAGGGRDLGGLLANLAGDGLDRDHVRHLLVTHAHADHAAGAAGVRAALGVRVAASPVVARCLREGDERAASLDVAREAGVYPADFGYPACPVDDELAEGAVIRVGNLQIEVIETPGHAAGHLTFLLRRGAQTSIFCGDAFFCGGRISLQDTWDCSLQDSLRSVERLAALGIDGLFPGHGTFALRHGHHHVERAMAAISRLRPPSQFEA